MDWFVWIIFAIPAVGVGIAIYERWKTRVLLKHDLNTLSTTQSEADREQVRNTEAMRARIMSDNWS